MSPKQLTRTYKPVGACKSTTAQFKEARMDRAEMLYGFLPSTYTHE